MKERDLKAGDLILWRRCNRTALVLSVSEHLTHPDLRKEAAALFDDGIIRHIPDYQWHDVEVVSA
jgi:hypothetical protein